MNSREKNMLTWLENYCAERPCDWGTNAALSMARAIFCAPNAEEPSEVNALIEKLEKLRRCGVCENYNITRCNCQACVWYATELGSNFKLIEGE